MKYGNKLDIALMNKWPMLFTAFHHQDITSTSSFRLRNVMTANSIGSLSSISLCWTKFFAGSLAAPTMESAELCDGTRHGALGSCFGRQTAETNQIMLILFRPERKAKCSLWQKADWFMGKCVPGYFVRRAKVPIILISGSFINFISLIIKIKCHSQFVKDQLVENAEDI